MKSKETGVCVYNRQTHKRRGLTGGLTLAGWATVILCAFFAFVSNAEDSGGPEGIAVPLMTKPPLIDGKIEPGEWDTAAQIEGFLHIDSNKLLDPRYGRTFIGYDNDNLYLAVSSELPPAGRLVATVKSMGGRIIYDDSVEAWIDPFRAERAKGGGAYPYCQFIGNSLNFFYQARFVPGATPDDGWNGNWKFKNGVDKERNRWDAELSVAWKDLGVPAGTNMSGREVGLLLSRNWKNPWDQSTCFRNKSFDNPMGYTALKLDAKAPSLSVSLGEIFKGKFAPEITVGNNSGKTARYTAAVQAAHTDMPEKTYSDTQDVPAGGARVLRMKESGDGFHPEAVHTALLKVISDDDGKTLLKRTVSWKYPVSAPYPWKITGGNGDSGLMLAYYPSFNKIRLKADTEIILGQQRADKLRAEILDGKGKKIKTGEFNLGKKTEEFVIDIPDINDGVYTLTADFTDGGKSVKTVRKSFEREHFPWEGNKLGITDKVYPPFTPIKTRGDKIALVLREYDLGKLGLPRSITAKGNEILAGNGMELIYTDGSGKKGSWKDITRRLLKSSDAEAVYEGSATSDDINVRLVSKIEYDGCAKVELEISPAKDGAALKEMRLDIPLREEIASLFHVCQASLRSNPAGELPKGEGVIWDSTKTGHASVQGNFQPYVWIGCEEEGIAWFADNDKGWILDDKEPCVKITREKARVTLSVMLINKRTNLDSKRKIVFGWQASPTKPMPEDWRKPVKDIPMMGGSNRYWGIRPSYAGKYPDGHDYSFADQLLIARKRKAENRAFLDSWYKKHYGDVTDKELEKSVKAHIYCGMGAAAQTGGLDGHSTAMLYLEEHWQDQSSPEWRVFQDEWGWQDYSPREWIKKIMSDDDSCDGMPVNPSKSYQDFVLWEAVEWLRRGIGIYCDNTFLRQSGNTFMTEAYQRENENIQISSGIWDMREYHKRMWVLTQECKPLSEYPLLISLHMTNTQLIPINTWDDINLDIEWRWAGGSKPFPPDLLRVQTIGRQTGSYPHALNSLSVDKNLFPEAGRHNWGIKMAHEILRSTKAGKYGGMEKIVRDFGYGEPDCKIFNYWDKDYPVAVSSQEVKSIAIERNGRLMVVLVSWAENPLDVKVKLDGALKKYSALHAVDAENGSAYKTENGIVLAPMKKYGVSLLLFGDQKI